MCTGMRVFAQKCVCVHMFVCVNRSECVCVVYPGVSMCAQECVCVAQECVYVPRRVCVLHRRVCVCLHRSV